MAKYKELSNKQKFLFWFLPISILITVVTFITFAYHFPSLINAYGIFYFPLIVGSLEGLLGTIFYFPGRFKKITPFTSILLIIPVCFSFYTYYANLNITLPITFPIVAIILILWAIAITMIIFGEILSSFFISRFLTPCIPKKDNIKKYAMCYELNNFESNKIIGSFNLVLESIFYYSIKEKKLGNGKHHGLLLRANYREYVFLDFLKEEKKLFILPFQLRYFIEIVYSTKESHSIQDFLSIFFNFNKTDAKSMEWNDFKVNFLEAIQPIQKKMLETFKFVIISAIIFICLIVFSTMFILNIDFVGKILGQLDITFIISMIIVSIFTSIIWVVLTLLGKRPLDFIKSKFSKK